MPSYGFDPWAPWLLPILQLACIKKFLRRSSPEYPINFSMQATYYTWNRNYGDNQMQLSVSHIFTVYRSIYMRSMKETPRRKITVTSSLNEISKDWLGREQEMRFTASPTQLFPQQAFKQIFEDNVNRFSSTSDICFIMRSLRTACYKYTNISISWWPSST